MPGIGIPRGSNPDGSKRQKKEEEDTFNHIYNKIVERDLEQAEKNKRRIRFLRLFRISSLVGQSALFVVSKAPLDIEFPQRDPPARKSTRGEGGDRKSSVRGG